MKKFVFVIIAALFVSIGCKDTNENLVQQRGKAVNVIMSEAVPSFFIDGDLENSFVGFDLSLPEGENVDKAELEVVFGNKSVILKSVQFPSPDMKITAMEMLQALGLSASNVKEGDTFYLYVLTTKNGITTRSTAALTINVTCGFDAELTAGRYTFENSDDWGAPGMVTIEADPDDPYKIYIDGTPLVEVEELTGNGNKVELIINPNSFKVSGSKVILSDDTKEWGQPYTNVAFQPVSGTFNSCDGTFRVTFAISVDQGGFGPFAFTFKRFEGEEEEPEPEEPDFSAEITFAGRLTDPDGVDFALADVVLGDDVDSVKVALLAKDFDIEAAIEDESIEDIIAGIDSGDIESVLLKKDGSVSVECMDGDGEYTFVVITYADEEVQEYAYITFDFPPVFTGEISGSSVPFKKTVVRKKFLLVN